MDDVLSNKTELLSMSFNNLTRVTSNKHAWSASSTPVSLLPVSKRARLLDDEPSGDTVCTYSEIEMDIKIKEHFIGK